MDFVRMPWVEVTGACVDAWKGKANGVVTAQVLSVCGVDTLRIRVEDAGAAFAPGVVQLSDGADLHFSSKQDAVAVVYALISALNKLARELERSDPPDFRAARATDAQEPSK